MGLFSWIGRLFATGHGPDELARRLGMDEPELDLIVPHYRPFKIPKRSGGTRRILAPDREFKSFQRRVFYRVLGRLRSHPCALGFERGHSIATHARRHCGRPVVVRLDIQDFFPTTRASRVRAYFRYIGWNRHAAELLTRWCTLSLHKIDVHVDG